MVVLLIVALRVDQPTAAVLDPALKINQPLSTKVGGKRIVVLKAHNLPSTDLGDWLVDIVYDPLVVSVESVHCASTHGPKVMCSSGVLSDKIRIIGFGGAELTAGGVEMAVVS